MADESDARWWHKPLIAGLGLIGGTITTFVSSHWGGVTKDDLDRAMRDEHGIKFVERLNTLDLSVKGESDSLKKYLDKQLLDMEARLSAPAAKKHRKDARGGQ